MEMFLRVGALILLFAGTAWADQRSTVLDVRFGVNENGRTRIVLDLSEDAKYRVEVASPDDKGKSLRVELGDSGVAIGSDARADGAGNGIGHVGEYDYTTEHDSRVRMSFALKRTGIPVSVFMIKPKEEGSHHRLVIDLVDSTDSEFEAARGKVFGKLKKAKRANIQNVLAQSQPAEITSLPVRSTPVSATPAQVAKQLLSAKRVPEPRLKPQNDRIKIVLDPGHGGKDPGSIGQAGLQEKTVTLAAAQKLEAILEDRGYDVILTRGGDTYPELEDRIAMARDEKADLFMSIHADAVSSPEIRGASVYTLSDKGSDRLVNEARKKGDFHYFDMDLTEHGEVVSEIVFDMVSNRSKAESSKFANLLIERLSGKVKMVNNTHREASYVVLLSPEVPAVLLELAFMSNAEDEKNLNSPAWRQMTMLVVADAIDSYFEKRRPVRQAMHSAGAQ